jgi:hypothetical protein
MKKFLEKAQQEEAFRELLAIMGANGGKVPYGAVDKLVKIYQKNGFKAVTRDNLNYRLKKNKKGVTSDSLIGGSVNVSVARSNDVTSDLSNPSDALVDILNTFTTTTTTTDVPDGEVLLNKKGGRAKGSTKIAAKENEKKKKELVTTCATIFNEAKEKAKKNRHFSSIWNS